MIDDLRHLPEDDAFQILSGDQCVILICIMVVLGAIFWPWLK